MNNRREMFIFVGALIFGVFFGGFGVSGWNLTVQRAQYAGNDNLGASLMDYQEAFFKKNQRYPATISEIDQSQLCFSDGASGEMIDEMVYFCDSTGSRFLAILGKGPRKVELRGVGGKVSFNAWNKHGARKPSR